MYDYFSRWKRARFFFTPPGAFKPSPPRNKILINLSSCGGSPNPPPHYTPSFNDINLEFMTGENFKIAGNQKLHLSFPLILGFGVFKALFAIWPRSTDL